MIQAYLEGIIQELSVSPFIVDFKVIKQAIGEEVCGATSMTLNKVLEEIEKN